MLSKSSLSDRRAISLFLLGIAAVTAGVLMHIPMFLMGRGSGYRLSGMPVDGNMIVGMALILGGIAFASVGLLPRDIRQQRTVSDAMIVSAPEDAPLTLAHGRLMFVLVIALVIDVMKPASLGFALPGMMNEYRLDPATVSLFPLFALIGTVAGSILWGLVADVYGRKATILLSAVMFVGTAICGAMPSFAWNVAMCFMMGVAAGGMLPVTYALLAEMMPSKHRGWALVLVGGLGSVGGYLAASGSSALLQPLFGWRILWLLNLPTGLALLALGGMIPESVKFLLARGRSDEARRIMERFGARVRKTPPVDQIRLSSGPGLALKGSAFSGKLCALSLAAISYGLINFGLLLWLPADLVGKGYSMELTSKLLSQSALIAFPTIFLAAYLYSRLSTKWSVVGCLLITLFGLLGVAALELQRIASPVLPVALLIVGTNGLIAMLLPYAAESFPLRIRGRTTGTVAACTKAGGVFAQSLAILSVIPALKDAALLILIPTIAAMGLVAWWGKETRGRDLRDLDRGGQPSNSAGG